MSEFLWLNNVRDPDEAWLLPVLLKLAEKHLGGWFVDIGAGAGRYTVPMVAAGVRTVAVEPDEMVVGANLVLNGFYDTWVTDEVPEHLDDVWLMRVAREWSPVHTGLLKTSYPDVVMHGTSPELKAMGYAFKPLRGDVVLARWVSPEDDDTVHVAGGSIT